MGTEDKEEIKLWDITLLMFLLHVFMQVFLYMINGHYFGIVIKCYMIRQRDSMTVFDSQIVVSSKFNPTEPEGLLSPLQLSPPLLPG